MREKLFTLCSAVRTCWFSLFAISHLEAAALILLARKGLPPWPHCLNVRSHLLMSLRPAVPWSSNEHSPFWEPPHGHRTTDGQVGTDLQGLFISPLPFLGSIQDVTAPVAFWASLPSHPTCSHAWLPIEVCVLLLWVFSYWTMLHFFKGFFFNLD